MSNVQAYGSSLAPPQIPRSRLWYCNVMVADNKILLIDMYVKIVCMVTLMIFVVAAFGLHINYILVIDLL